jgi:hypothetical protein
VGAVDGRRRCGGRAAVCRELTRSVAAGAPAPMARTAPVPNIPAIPGMNPGTLRGVRGAGRRIGDLEPRAWGFAAQSAVGDIFPDV